MSPKRRGRCRRFDGLTFQEPLPGAQEFWARRQRVRGARNEVMCLSLGKAVGCQDNDQSPLDNTNPPLFRSKSLVHYPVETTIIPPLFFIITCTTAHPLLPPTLQSLVARRSIIISTSTRAYACIAYT